MSEPKATMWTTNINDLSFEEGDLIEIDRVFYHHWGMYVSDGKIIHLETVESPTQYVVNSQFDELVPAIIKYDPLNDVTDSSKFCINNKLEIYKNPRKIEDLRKLIKISLENPRVLEYSLKYFNCEHFVTFLKFGISDSEQMPPENQFLLSFVLNTGANYLAKLNGKKNPNSNAWSPLMNAFGASVQNEVYQKPTIEEKIKRNLEQLYGQCG